MQENAVDIMLIGASKGSPRRRKICHRNPPGGGGTKWSKTHVEVSLIPTFTRGDSDTSGPPLKGGGAEEELERGGRRGDVICNKGGGCVMAVEGGWTPLYDLT